jgi:hypothetical protein
MSMDAIKSSLITNIINKNIIKIPIVNNPNIISYKNPNFKETDEELLTLRGMANAEMLSDPVLIHTFLIAYNYHNFITSYISGYKNYFKNDDKEKKSLNFDNIKNHKHNLKFNMDNLFGDDYEYNQDKDKYLQRLANLLYKAINICYDGKSDFSRNLIIYTDRAFKNSFANYYNINEIGYNQNFKFELEIPFLESDVANNNDYLYMFIDANLKFDRNRTLTDSPNLDNNKTKMKEFYSSLKNKQVFFYTKEDSERVNECRSGEILDGEKKCKVCSEVCNIDTCKTNPRCAFFCDDICATAQEDEEKTSGICGDKKKKPKDKHEKNEGGKISDPIDESYKIPDFTTIFKSAIKIFFALIILYMCYIFYQIYGETITTLLNLVIFQIYNFTDWISLKFQKNVNKYEHDFHIKDYIRKNASDKFERVVNKLKTPLI